MFGFGGEKYSREAFDEAEQKLNETKEAIDTTPGGRGYVKIERGEFFPTLDTTGKSPSFRAPDRRVWVESPLGKQERKAKEKLQKLLASGHKEAIALNEEYDRLQKKVNEAIQALADFERDNLGVDDTNTFEVTSTITEPKE